MEVNIGLFILGSSGNSGPDPAKIATSGQADNHKPNTHFRHPKPKPYKSMYYKKLYKNKDEATHGKISTTKYNLVDLHKQCGR